MHEPLRVVAHALDGVIRNLSAVLEADGVDGGEAGSVLDCVEHKCIPNIPVQHLEITRAPASKRKSVQLSHTDTQTRRHNTH